MPQPVTETGAAPDRPRDVTEAPPPAAASAAPGAAPAAPARPSIAIEFDLAAGHAARVFRHKALAERRRGRTRTEEAAVTWHDAPDGFERDGALLARTAAGWAVQRTVRSCGWPVGTETLAMWEPPGEGDAAPRAVAAFQGSIRRVELAAPDAAPLALSLLEGTLRNVTAELACSRVRVEGEPREAARLALTLGETLPLVPASLSLAELAGTLGHDPGGEPATPTITPAGDVDAALAALFGSLSAALLLWLTRLGTFGADAAPTDAAVSPRAVHQARVATRRLRSALIVFAEPLGGSLDPLAGPLKALAASLGQARDWDVFQLETGAPIAAGLDHDRRITALLDDAGTARRAAHAELRRALGRPAVRRLVLHLSLLAQLRPWRERAVAGEPDPLAQPVRALAPGLVDRRFRRLVRVGKHLDGLAPAELHEVRKTAKKLRYALEFLAPVLARGPTRKLLRRLSTLQDQLGALNDIAVGADLMGRIAPRAGANGAGAHEFASGAVAGWLAARAAASQAELGETWRAVRHTERFWRL